MGDGSFYEKLTDGGDVEGGSGSTVATEVPVSTGVQEGNTVAVKLAVDGGMIPPVQPVIRVGEREDGGAEVVANGSMHPAKKIAHS